MTDSQSPEPPEAARTAAVERANELLALLAARSDRSRAARAIEETEHLVRAVRAFHMEAIRFRMFNIDRLLSNAASGAGPAELAALDALHRALGEAGFHTRSHPQPS